MSERPARLLVPVSAALVLLTLAPTTGAIADHGGTVTNCVGIPDFRPPPECRADEHNTRACRQSGDTRAVGYVCEPFVNGCPTYAMERAIPGYRHWQKNLPRRLIGGTRFPRVGRLQYRGIRTSMDQFTVPKTLRAIGGDQTPTIGSRLHWQIASILHDPTKLHTSYALRDRLRRAYRWYVLGIPALFMNAERILADHGILEDVRRLLACRPSYNERDAAMYARDLTAKAFRHLARTWGATFSRHLFAYDTPEFLEYGDYQGGLHLYSSAYPLMAEAYGAKILVFTNFAGQTLDMNYWNFVRNGGNWGYHYADRAEFVTAGTIDPRAVAGIWITDESGRDKMGRDTAMSPRRITYALMRLRFHAHDYGVILDTATVGCLVRVGAHFETCVNRIPPGWKEKPIRDVGEIEFGRPSGNGHRVPVIAVVRACDVNRRDCGVADGIFAEMPLSDRRLTPDELRAIRRASFSRGNRLFVQHVRQAADLSGASDGNGD